MIPHKETRKHSKSIHKYISVTIDKSCVLDTEVANRKPATNTFKSSVTFNFSSYSHLTLLLTFHSLIAYQYLGFEPTVWLYFDLQWEKKHWGKSNPATYPNSFKKRTIFKAGELYNLSHWFPCGCQCSQFDMVYFLKRVKGRKMRSRLNRSLLGF